MVCCSEEERVVQDAPRSPSVRVRMKQDFDYDATQRHSPYLERAKSTPAGPSSPPELAPWKEAHNLRHPPGYKWQMPIFGLWLGTCAAAVVTCLRASEEAYNELFHIYYQPLIIMLSMFWLWGIAVRVFELMAIRYEACFSSQEQKHLLNSRQVYQTASILSCVVAGSAAMFSYHCMRLQIEAASIHPPLMFCLLAVLLVLPLDVVYKETRLFFSWTFYRVTTPVREVTFADFLLADVLTSLAKALSDCERALCHLAAGPVMLPHSTDQVCGNSSWLIPLGLSLPYAWRLCQCIRVNRDTGNRAQLYNALKYSTAFPVVLFSYMNYHTDEATWISFYRPLWVMSAMLNSAYSYYWDVERDWDIQWFSAPAGPARECGVKKPSLKSQLLYPPYFYWYLLASNLVLRLSWTYKLSPHLRGNFNTVMLFTLLEVFRRFQWMFVRLEVELRKIQAQKPEIGPLVPPAHAPIHSKVDVKHLLASAPSMTLPNL